MECVSEQIRLLASRTGAACLCLRIPVETGAGLSPAATRDGSGVDTALCCSCYDPETPHAGHLHPRSLPHPWQACWVTRRFLLLVRFLKSVFRCGFVFYFCVQVFCLHVCLCAMCVPGAQGGQKRVQVNLGPSARTASVLAAELPLQPPSHS